MWGARCLWFGSRRERRFFVPGWTVPSKAIADLQQTPMGPWHLGRRQCLQHMNGTGPSMEPTCSKHLWFWGSRACPSVRLGNRGPWPLVLRRLCFLLRGKLRVLEELGHQHVIHRVQRLHSNRAEQDSQLPTQLPADTPGAPPGTAPDPLPRRHRKGQRREWCHIPRPQPGTAGLPPAMKEGRSAAHSNGS